MIETLVTLYQYNVRLIEKQAALLQPEQDFVIVGGYNINWLVGHLISGRQRVLERVGHAHVWTPEQRSPYMNGSQPQAKDGPGVQRLETLLDTLHHTQSLIEEGLRRTTAEQLAAPSPFPHDHSVAGSLLYFQYHEAHHVGQIVLIAQTLGVAGVWLS
ncbi:DinB family protein [bacterium]|nr:DinB family protein [bacterium]